MSNPIAPNVLEVKLGPDQRWSQVELDDLDGSGFEAIKDWAVSRRLSRALGDKNNKFISGASSFITYTIRPQKRQVKAKVATKTEAPVNEKARVTKGQRRFMTETLETEIASISAFLWKDILPFSLAWSTAVANTEERLQQVLGAEKIPIMAYVKGRVNEAIQLRINRHITSQFKLSAKESEFLQMQMKHRYQVYLQKEIAAVSANTNTRKERPKNQIYDDEVPE